MSIQSSGKLINHRNSNFELWSATFQYFGIKKIDSKGIKNAKYRQLDKV